MNTSNKFMIEDLYFQGKNIFKLFINANNLNYELCILQILFFYIFR